VASTADRGVFFKASNLLPTLYRLLAQMPVWVTHFPFFEVASAGDLGSELWKPGMDRTEPISGLFAIRPLCLAGLALPLVLYCFRGKIAAPVRVVLLTIYAAAFVNLAAITVTVLHPAQRYLMDFAPEILVLSVFVLLFLAERASGISSRRAAL